IKLLVVLHVIALAAFHYWIKKLPSQDEVARITRHLGKEPALRGKIAPDLDLAILDGRGFKLSDHVGQKVIVLNFFATWCGPCKEEMAAFNRFYLEHKEAGLVLVGIDASEQEDQVRDFICQQDLKFPVAIDHDGEIQKKYQVSGYPTTVVIGADGRVSLYQVGMIENVPTTLGAAFLGQRNVVQHNAGIDREAYLLAQPPVPAREEFQSNTELLRSHQIAQAMNCPCGCDHDLADCTCRTATQAKKKLRAMDLKSLSDAQAMAQINREFCPGTAK